MLKAVTEFMMAWAELAHRVNPFRPHCAPALDKASGCRGITTFGGEDYPWVVRLGRARNFGTRDGIRRVANRKAWSLAAGALITVACLLILRRRLQRLWEEFPLLPTDSDENRDGEHETG